MSDPFADLWNSSPPQPTPPAAQKKPRQDVFTLLAASSTSPPSLSKITPNPPRDVFSSLLGQSFTSTSSHMTIAERARLQDLSTKPVSQAPASPAWDGLETLAKSPSLSNSSQSVDDWGFGPIPPQPVARPSSSLPSTALLDDDLHDDILGELGKPIDSIHFNKPSNSPPSLDRAAAPSPSLTPSKSRPISPPPHILGQIVEMGFSVQQARVALAATDTGLDVQAALDTLLSNGAAASAGSSEHASRESPDFRDRSQTSASRLMPHDRGTPSPSNRERDANNLQLQEHADKLIAQASEIGLSVFNKASAFWKEKKGQVQKAYVERTAPSPGNEMPGGTRAGRPRWMQERLGDDQGWKDCDGTAFLDDDVPQQQQRSVSPPGGPPQSRNMTVPQHRTGDLLSDEPLVSAYVSPFRRGKGQPFNPPAGIQLQPPRNPPGHTLSPPPPRPHFVSASLESISRSNNHKSSGTDAFKLGQFSTAESHYANAIAALPSSHLLLIPLYTNRALARIKTGDYVGAAEDCTAALDIVAPQFNPRRETSASQRRVDREEEGAGVDLAEGWVKAVRRRAEALEGREKWEDAGRDWNVLAGTQWVRASAKGEAVRGAGRCRRMVQGESNPQSANVQRPKVRSNLSNTRRPVPTSTPSALPSRALENLRNANNAAEAEDQQRHELKDSIDAKLLAWKAGKEANIRALLASLDMVLWPELGIAKPGMADLVTATQVKGKYLRVIARLHPDKLNVGNTTVEQRMLANGVFGMLNEAWNDFIQ